MKIVLIDNEDGGHVTMGLTEVIEDINRDRSSEWTDYDESDWLEGLEEWTQYSLKEVILSGDEWKRLTKRLGD